MSAVALKQADLRLVASRIRRARRDAGLTLDGLAENVGSSRQHLIALEKAKHRPRIEMLTKIAEATGRPVEFFVEREERAA